MTDTLHKRKCVISTMQLLDAIGTIEKCFNEIQKDVNAKCKNPNEILAKVKEGRQCVLLIRKLSVQFSDKRTLLAHRHLEYEGERPKIILKSNRRSSKRHAKKVKKRKFAELDEAGIKSSLMDLQQSGRLRRPADICQVIYGDDSPEHKKKRATIFKILSSQLNVAKEKTLRNCFTKYRKWIADKANNPPVSEYFGSRRPTTMPLDEFKLKLKMEVEKNAHHQKDLRELVTSVLTKHMQDKHKKANKSDKIKVSPSRSTVDIYTRIATPNPDFEHVGKARHSTKARDTAIRSFRAVSTFISVVLASQSIPDPDTDLPTVVARKGKRDVESLFPYPVKWINPALLLNTDETTLVLVKNKRGPPKWIVVSKRFKNSKKKCFSEYTTEPDPSQVVCRMKLITTSNADGEEAPLFFVVKVSEKEMPDVSMELIKIPGLAPGANKCRGMNQAGYVLFVRKGGSDADETVDEAIFRMADKYQVSPFILDIRKRVFGWDGNVASLRREHTSVCSCDGALSQIKFLVSDEYVNWCADNLVVRVKHHASRTSVEQMQDLAAKFRTIKGLLKKEYQVSGTSLKLRRGIEEALRRNGKVRLADKHKGLILDTLAKMPDITARAISADDNIRAFARNGQNVDGKPSYTQMLNTCIRDITQEEEELLWRHLPAMIQLVDKPELTETPEPTPGRYDCAHLSECRPGTGPHISIHNPFGATMTQKFMLWNFLYPE